MYYLLSFLRSSFKGALHLRESLTILDLQASLIYVDCQWIYIVHQKIRL